MITDIEAIFQKGRKWPPEDQDTQERLDLYKRNEHLFEGCHNKVWQDELRKLRGDKSGELRLKLNYFQMLSLLWADLVCGEIPDAKPEEEAQADNLTRIIQDNELWSIVGDAIIDASKNGDAPIKIRYDGKRGIIENVPPEYWIPVVEASNVKQVKAHILAYEFEVPGENKPAVITVDVASIQKGGVQLAPEGQIEAIKKMGLAGEDKISYLKVEIHTIGRIEHRLYRLVKHEIREELDLSALSDFKDLEKFQDTGLDDFAIQVIHNIRSTKKYHGKDDYTIILDIVKELEIRYPQIFFVLDKFTDPWVYGPPIEEQNPRDGEYVVMGGARYISLTEGQQPPGAMTWDAQMPSNFQVIAGEGWGLMQRFYELSETCKVCFDASAGGQGLSAQALRLMMWKPLKKANRLQSRANPVVQKLVSLCSKIEVDKKMKGAIEISKVKFVWHDGLPQDHNADAQRESTLVTGGVRSAQGLMRDKGMPEDQITKEMEEIKGPAQGTPEPPQIELPPMV